VTSRAALGLSAVLALLVGLVVPLSTRELGLVAGCLVAVGVVVALLARLEWALLVLVALSPLEDLLGRAVHPQVVKGLGALVFCAAAVRLLGPRGGLRSHPAHRCLWLFLLLALAAAAARPNGAVGLEVLVRYFSFSGVFVAAVLCFTDRRAVWRVFAAYVLGATTAAGVGLHAFLTGAVSRAEGPLDDPNDLAFALVVAVPMAFALFGRSRRPGWLLLSLVCVLGAAATVSRGGGAALAAAAVWAVTTGVVARRVVVAAASSAVLALAGVVWYARDLVGSALEQKTSIAANNVDTRVLRWQAALEMIGEHPLLGMGPAGFRLNYEEWARAYDPTTVPDGTVVHQMFLEVGAELGLPALLAFVAFVGVALLAAADVRRRAVDPEERLLGAATEAGLVATVVASLFLTEQYYVPLWILAAAAVALQQRLPLRPVPAAPPERVPAEP
jgi:putative inorganic carbon (hco3(-)) transporter